MPSQEANLLQDKLGSAFLGEKTALGMTYLLVEPDSVPIALEALRDDPELAYDYFSECVGVDYSKWEHARDFEARFEVVYNLMSTKTMSRVFVKTAVNDGQSIPTCLNVFLGAEYPEREISDMFGLVFSGNEHETRFLLPDDWYGYPLRKEFPLGGEDVLFDRGDRGPAVEDKPMAHAGESFEGKTGTEDVSGR